MRQIPWKMFMYALLLTGCTSMCSVNREEMTADQVVEAYLEVALNMSDIAQKAELLDFTTGKLKAAIAGASSEAIQKAYIDRNYSLKQYSLVERNDKTPRETEITYLLSYHELEDGKENTDEAPLVSTENTVAVIKEKGVWYIRDVLGNKTSIEFPVTELNSIKASPSK